MLASVLIGDLIESRSAPDRRSLATRVEGALETLRERFSDAWHAPMVTTRGLDEISSVLVRPEVALDVVFELNLELWPQRFRFALGRGAIDVRFESGDAAEMDGSAFHHAAAGLARLKKTGAIFAIEGVGSGAVGITESVAQLVGTLMADWTETEASTVRVYRREGTQKSTAEALGIRQPTVSGTLKRAHFAEIEHALSEVRVWLSNTLT